MATASSFGAQEFALGVSAALFAFGGWHMVTYTAGETRDAVRTVPRALLIGVLIVTACYIGLNAAYLRILPIAQGDLVHARSGRCGICAWLGRAARLRFRRW